MKNSKTTLSIVMASLVTLGGCAAGGPRMEQTPLASMFYPTTGDDRITFDVHGPLEIDVESFGGSVTIKADDRERQATVRVVRRAVHGPGRYKEAKESLGEIDYSAEMVPGELGRRLQVRTSTSHPEPHFLRAHLEITVPDAEGIRVRTRNGDVYVTGIAGAVDIATTDGDVRVMTNRPMRQPVTIVNARGDIDYRVRGESTALFDCETIGGTVRHRVRYGHLTIDRGTKHDRLFARLNDGTNPVTLRTVYGNIRVAVVDNPTQVGLFIE